MKLTLQYFEGAFTVVAEDKSKCKKLKNNQQFTTVINGPFDYRSRRQLILYWVLIGKVVENSNFPTKEDVDEYVKLKIKWVDTFYNPNGERFIKTRSIALENMEQFLFNKYFDNAVKVMADLIEVSPQELLNSQDDI